MSSDFIESNYPDFWNAYKTAEEVVKSFPNVCIQQIRIIAENITKEVMRLANMEGIEDDQWRRLEYLRDCQIIDNEIFGLLTEIRKLGNDAAHELGSYEDLQKAYNLTEKQMSDTVTVIETCKRQEKKRPAGIGKLFAKALGLNASQPKQEISEHIVTRSDILNHIEKILDNHPKKISGIS